MSDFEPDEAGYFRFIEDCNLKEVSNSETYDRALLALSSVLLGVSLTFTENVVPLRSAEHVWVLVLSWFLFAATIIVVICSFIYGQNSFKTLKEGARKFYLEGDKSTNKISEDIASNIRLINSASGVAFILAVILFTIFVTVNIYQGAPNAGQEDIRGQIETPNEQSGSVQLSDADNQPEHAEAKAKTKTD